MPTPDLTTLHARRAIDGDLESLAWIVERFTPLLRAQAVHRLGSALSGKVDPDDILSEAWLVALRKLPEFEIEGSRSTPVLLSYLARCVRLIANNALRAHLRGQARQAASPASGSDPLGKLEDRVAGILTEVTRNEASIRIARALADLDEREREVVILRGIEGLSNVEIGQVLGEKANTVSHVYHRAVERLREKLPGSVFGELVDG